MNIYLIRHAEVEERYQGCYNGWIDIALSQNGRLQARELAEKLKEIDFGKVYSSDLKRCKESLGYFGFENVIYEKSLREKQWGDCEGLNYEEACSLKKSEYRDFGQWLEVLGGESMESFSTRIENVFLKKIFLEKSDNILVMTHAGVIRTLLGKIKNISMEECFGLDVAYASCTVIEKNDFFI